MIECSHGRLTTCSEPHVGHDALTPGAPSGIFTLNWAWHSLHFTRIWRSWTNSSASPREGWSSVGCSSSLMSFLSLPEIDEGPGISSDIGNWGISGLDLSVSSFYE